jgi:hypothetical protein
MCVWNTENVVDCGGNEQQTWHRVVQQKQAIRATLYIRDLCPLMVFFSFSFLFFSFVAFSLSFSLSTFSFFLFSLFILNTLLTNPTMDRNNLWSIGTWTWTQTVDAVVWVWARTKTLSILGIPSDDLPATHRNKNIVTKWRRSKEQRNKLASKHKVYAALKLKS